MGDNDTRKGLLSKKRLDEKGIIARASKELKDGQYVNLGFGMPTLLSNMLPFPDKTLILQAETGLLNYGRMATKEEAEEAKYKYIDGSGMAVIPLPGLCIFNMEEGFDMIRSGKVDWTILGGLQVSEKGDLANWRSPGVLSSIGGAMDLAVGAKNVMVCMMHCTPKGEFKIVKECSFDLTAKGCVDIIVTDIAVIYVTEKGLLLREVAPGWTSEDVQTLTEPKLIISSDLKEIDL
ncbi:MAG: CoA-transferase [Thermodesulfobacteriota bacterium]